MLDALTALRFFAAAMIVVGHGDHLVGSFGIANAVPLNQGVSFFFVLSGFILAYNYPSFSTRAQFQHFFIARFARIWPLHLVTCLLWIALIFHGDKSIYFPGAIGSLQLVANLFMVQSWVPLRAWALSFNGVAWSISCEFFFYLAFPFIVIFWKRYWHLLVSLSGAIVIVVLAIANHLQLPGDDNYQGIGLLSVVYFGPVIRIFEFTVGVGIANLLRKMGPLKLLASQWLVFETMAIGALVVAMVGATYTPSIERIFGSVVAYYIQREGLWLFWGLLIGVFAITQGPIGRFLSTRPMVFLGEISFALYLVHAIVISYMDPYAERIKASQHLVFLEFWVLCLGLAALLFIGIERPFRGLIMNSWKKRDLADPAKRKLPFGALEIGSLAALTCAIIAMSIYRPTTASVVDAAAQKAFIAAEGFNGAGGTYSNGIRVVGLQVKMVDGKLMGRVLMTAERRLSLDAILAVHLNDAAGVVIARPGDFPLDNARSRVEAGTFWIQSFLIAEPDLNAASSLALALYTNPPDLLTVVGGRTDWENKRLLFNVK